MPTINTRLLETIMLGANVQIVKFGEPEGANKVGLLLAPAPPTAEAPGKWISLGRTKTAKAQIDAKTLEREGLEEDGCYHWDELRISTKSKLQFTTQDISPEAIQLMFGLPDVIKDGTAQIPFTAASGDIQVWMYLRLRDAYNQGKELATMLIAGKLHLVNPVSMGSELTNVEWELSILYSSLNDFDPAAIAGTIPTT